MPQLSSQGESRSADNCAPFLSIIVPVFNAEPYLEGFLQNILGQAYKNFELILVDDKSTDCGLALLREYQRRDHRIHVVPLPVNVGASTARNIGLMHARGAYVRFIDCDDLLPPDSCELLCTGALEFGSDVVKGYLYSYDPTSGTVAENHWGGRSYGQEQKINQPLTNLPELWNLYDHHSMIMRRSLLVDHEIRYPVLKNFQDPPMMAQVLSVANTITILPHNVYLYVSSRNDQSILRSRWTVENYEALLDGYEIMLRHLAAKGLQEVLACKITTFARDWFGKILLLHDWQAGEEVHALLRRLNSIGATYDCQLFQQHDPPYIRIFFTLLAAQCFDDAHVFLNQLVCHNNANRIQTLQIHCPAAKQTNSSSSTENQLDFRAVTAPIISALAALCVSNYGEVVVRIEGPENVASSPTHTEIFVQYTQLVKALGGTLVAGNGQTYMAPHMYGH